MEIKHHHIFQVYLPKNIGENDDLTSMLLEEAHLMSNGEMTPDFEPNDNERKPLDVILYPSFVYAARKMKNSEVEQIEEINTRIDVEFSRMLLWINPIYRITEFIEYHFENCKRDKQIFLKHIEYVILPLIKKIIENQSSETLRKEYPDYEHVEKIIKEWILKEYDKFKPEKIMGTENKFETKIENVENVIVNNNSKIKHQHNPFSKKPKKQIIAIFGLIISVIMLIIAVIVNWDKLF